MRGIEIVFEGRRGPGCNIGIEFKDPGGNLLEITCQMEQVGWHGSRPHHMHRRAKSLEEAVSNPVPAADEAQRAAVEV